MSSPRIRIISFIVSSVLVLGACGSSSEPDSAGVLQYVGRIPGVQADGSGVIVGGVRAELPILDGEMLGPRASGNRLLVIGDSIFESTSRRYGGDMCTALVPLGWRVAVEAKSGELVGFGRTVIRERINEGWDAAVVFLGTNFGGDQVNYERDLTRIVDALAPRPTLLLTATLFRDSMKLVNESIRRVASLYPNVSVLDWGTASLQEGILNRDKIHPTDAGRKVLVASVAAALGNAPKTPGSCLVSMSDLPLDEDNGATSTTVDDSNGTSPTTTVPAQSTTTVAPSSPSGQ
ncbi:unannotated protein [freshwater metagenome]|uniref:Unannotated protein n=1 Tax=freshwater metagenome TaxID=449393 RepID=A0A6J6E1H7_9ZZZZ|nr:hypothetical protein [Actinomycetota bacterium]